MDRREAVKYVSLLLGGTIVGANFFLTGCSTETKHAGKEFTQDDYAYLDEIADTILPDTKTPGAKAAKVGQFMTVMVNDCYSEKNQKTFKDGMDKLNEVSKKKYDNSFMNITPQQRHDLLVQLDSEQRDYTKNKKPDDDPHYF